MAQRRVLVVDDHPIVRLGLRELLHGDPRLRVCGEADSQEEALAILEREHPDLAIVDLSLKGGHGFDLIRAMRSIRPDLRILVVSMHDDVTYVERSLEAGANGYLQKDEATERLAGSVRQILSGGRYVSERFASLLGDAGRRTRHGLDSLTNRELQVLGLIGKGLSTTLIATQLRVSVKTIETYRANIKAKLGLTTAADLLRYALRQADQGDRSGRA